MSINSRLSRLEKTLGRAGEPCPGGITVIVSYCPQDGEQKPETPPDAPACHLCGQVHALVIKEVIVEPREGEGLALDMMNQAEGNSDA